MLHGASEESWCTPFMRHACDAARVHDVCCLPSAGRPYRLRPGGWCKKANPTVCVACTHCRTLERRSKAAPPPQDGLIDCIFANEEEAVTLCNELALLQQPPTEGTTAEPTANGTAAAAAVPANGINGHANGHSTDAAVEAAQRFLLQHTKVRAGSLAIWSSSLGPCWSGIAPCVCGPVRFHRPLMSRDLAAQVQVRPGQLWGVRDSVHWMHVALRAIEPCPAPLPYSHAPQSQSLLPRWL